MRPTILIAGPEDRTAYFEPYAVAVRFAGGEPDLRLPGPEISGDKERLCDFLSFYHGVLLPGGADIDPAEYGEPPHPKLGKSDHTLDTGQLAVARILLEDRRPTLAICRGLQIAAVAAGGTLYQDLPDQYESTVKIDHQIKEPKDALIHEVGLEAGGRLAEICGEVRFDVNSRHHQAAREGTAAGRIGPLRIAARADDGVIEGLEIPGHPFFLAVQWHPENLVDAHPPSQNLLRAFVQAGEMRTRSD
jgi:putative glutamine amidotransferase